MGGSKQSLIWIRTKCRRAFVPKDPRSQAWTHQGAGRPLQFTQAGLASSPSLQGLEAPLQGLPRELRAPKGVSFTRE